MPQKIKITSKIKMMIYIKTQNEIKKVNIYHQILVQMKI